MGNSPVMACCLCPAAGYDGVAGAKRVADGADIFGGLDQPILNGGVERVGEGDGYLEAAEPARLVFGLDRLDLDLDLAEWPEFHGAGGDADAGGDAGSKRCRLDFKRREAVRL